MAFFKNILKPTENEDLPYQDGYAPEQVNNAQFADNQQAPRPVNPMPAYMRNLPNNAEIVLVEASDIAGAQEIAMHFKRGASVVCDLSNMNATDFQRSLDFISGVAFVLEGNFTKVSREIYLLMPKQVTYRTDKAAGPVSDNSETASY